MVGTFLEPSCGRSNAPIHNIPYSVAQPLERGSKNYYSIIQGVMPMNANQWNYRVQYARDHYPPGTRVRLLNMPDDPQPIPPGTTGTVVAVDDAGQLLMPWHRC